MKTGALILSTGKTLHRCHFDPLQMVGSISVVQRLIMTFRMAGADPVVLAVSPENREQLEKHASRMGAVFLSCAIPDGEMFDYVKTGLSYLSKLCDRVLITPVDTPLFDVETVRALLDSGHPLAVPRWGEQNGHPLLVPSAVIPSLLAYTGEQGLRGAVRSSGLTLTALEVPDPGVILKSEEAAEHQSVISGHSLNRWRPVAKLQIARESTFLGPGSRQLLRLIDTTGSVRLACQQMGMSYSKAWKILNSLEDQLEFPVVIRKKGGRQGGETQLTDQGLQLLAQFDAFEQDCQQAIAELFAKHFDDGSAL